eukprot:Gb_04542 [translate_table: standard]
MHCRGRGSREIEERKEGLSLYVSNHWDRICHCKENAELICQSCSKATNQPLASEPTIHAEFPSIEADNYEELSDHMEKVLFQPVEYLFTQRWLRDTKRRSHLLNLCVSLVASNEVDYCRPSLKRI